MSKCDTTFSSIATYLLLWIAKGLKISSVYNLTVVGWLQPTAKHPLTHLSCRQGENIRKARRLMDKDSVITKAKAEFTSKAFIAEHDVMYYGISFWSFFVSGPGCISSQSLACPQTICWKEWWWWEADAVQALFSNDWSTGVLSTLFWPQIQSTPP